MSSIELFQNKTDCCGCSACLCPAHLIQTGQVHEYVRRNEDLK